MKSIIKGPNAKRGNFALELTEMKVIKDWIETILWFIFEGAPKQ